MSDKIFEGQHGSGQHDYGGYELPCGAWHASGLLLCKEHEEKAEAEYPQGWRAYPGDTCPHGMYTGGVGIDWICGPCEMGE